jgi:tRNA nucleotidyltransferase (CCA-adding enzyme)
MTGEEFATKLAEYMKSTGLKMSSIGVIKVNPDQSKHLATATLKLLDISIDINNFRSEVYHGDSRIPEIQLSTAEEDALRRDFTLNAMFFNIHTGKIEDYVGGLPDLRNKLLRTPREPYKTFRDDPLRVLRAARCAGRFGYKVHEDIVAAAKTKEVQQDLETKVSRERMGIEVHKMVWKTNDTTRESRGAFTRHAGARSTFSSNSRF